MLIPPPSELSSTQTIAVACEEFDRVCKWLIGVGVGLSANRVGYYRKLFSELIHAQRTNNFGNFMQSYAATEVYNAVLERAQLVRIYNGLGALRNSDLTKRLKKATAGHKLHVLDQGASAGRDFSLELDVAARFVIHGYQVDFSHLADVSARQRGGPVFVECKRLRSARRVEENVKKALAQLERRYRAAPNPDACRGLIVLSIGMVSNPNFTHFEGRDASQIALQCGVLVDEFVKKYSRHWLGVGVDPRTLGVVVQLDAPGLTTVKGVPFSIHEIAVSNIVSQLSSDFQVLLEICKIFGPAS